MSTALTPAPRVLEGEVRLPDGFKDLESFRLWSRSEARPEKLNISYLNGVIWIDLTPEQLYTHNQAKMAVQVVLGKLADEAFLGEFYVNGMMFSHPGANLSTEPDGTMISYDSFRSGRVRGLPDAKGVGVIEFEGSPDMVLEVISDSSQPKDDFILPRLYHAAGITEFWRFDARGDLRFEILRRDPSGYVPTQQPDGWWRSEVFGRDFLLTAGVDPLGQPRFTLHHRP